MSTMLAARVDAGSTAPALEQVPVPEPGPGEVLVRVGSAGLAAGTMNLLRMGALKNLPTTIGQGVAGTVDRVGEGVDAGLEGSRVRVHPMLSCRTCTSCRNDQEMLCPTESAIIGQAAFAPGPLTLYGRYHDGGMAEYVLVPAWLVDVLPENVSLDVGAMVHDLGIAVRTLRQAALSPGGTLVIAAATGTMGTTTVRLAPFFGAGRLILVGRSPERLEAVAALSSLPVQTVATDTLDEGWEERGGLTRAIRALAPAGVDAVADYTPSGPGSAQCLASLRTGGTLVHTGGNMTPLPMPLVAIMGTMWRVVGSRGCTRTDTDQVLALLGSGALSVDDLVTHRWPLTELDAAVAVLTSRSEPLWVGLVKP